MSNEQAKYLQHELLDRSLLIAENFDKYIVQHIEKNENDYGTDMTKIKKEAEVILDKLCDFYQSLGGI